MVPNGTVSRSLWAGALLVAWSSGTAAPVTIAQEDSVRAIRVSALPALDYNSDEGLGYGLVGGLYAYGADDRRLYRWSLEPIVFFTTGGRREIAALFDAPALAGSALRVTALAAWERDCCYPYFGVGNGTSYDPGLFRPSSGPNHYSYHRDRLSLILNLQWSLNPTFRLLAGVAGHRNEASSRGLSTLFASDSARGEVPVGDLAALSIGPKVGIVVDTRDRERDPGRGVWLEALIWQGARFLGSEHGFARYSATARGYWPVAPRFTAAGRVMAESVRGPIPVTMLPDMASSFRDFTGLGGARSVRGVFKGRYLGHSRVIANLELRWRGGERRFAGQRWRPGVVAFMDAGRVWARGTSPDVPGLHWGRGVGIRLTWVDAFIVALDLAHGAEAGVQTYVGLGHLF